MRISPFIIGSGLAGLTIRRSLGLVQGMEKRISMATPVWVPRGADLKSLVGEAENPFLFIANPHGLHAPLLLAARDLGFKGILCEKPACTNLREVEMLRDYPQDVAIYHGYRATWGAKAMRALVESGELGEVFAVHGKYWQSSTAEKALDGVAKESWKNDPALSGAYDVLLDLSTHWLDLATYVVGKSVHQIQVWKNFTNAESAHRDSHVHLTVDYAGGAQAQGTVSKNAHGAGNELTLEVLGSKGSVSWSFQNADEIVIGQGRNRKVVARQDREFGSGNPAFHAMGWIEGYLEITRQAILEMALGEKGSFPRLSESLPLLEKLLSAPGA